MTDYRAYLHGALDRDATEAHRMLDELCDALEAKNAAPQVPVSASLGNGDQAPAMPAGGQASTRDGATCLTPPGYPASAAPSPFATSSPMQEGT